MPAVKIPALMVDVNKNEFFRDRNILSSPYGPDFSRALLELRRSAVQCSLSGIVGVT